MSALTNPVTLPAEFLARPNTVAHSVARVLAERGLERVYGLPGGHTKTIWDELDRAGLRIVSTRHECAAVHMAQAEAELRSDLAVAIVTAGPGLTNAVTGIACADLARVPVLVLSAVPPAPQEGMGALEEIDQAAAVAPVARFARSVRDPRHALGVLDSAIAAAIGEDGPEGAAYLDFTTEVLRMLASPAYEGEAAFRPRRRSERRAIPAAVEAAAKLIGASRRPLVIAGRAVRSHADLLHAFLAATGALCLDTRESKGAVADDEPGFVPAVRGRAMAEADLVVTLGRNLDFEVAYGSASVFRPGVRFLRIGRTFDELARNRRGDVELCADVSAALEAMVETSAAPADPDRAWRDRLIAENSAKAEGLDERLASAADGADGRMHPYALLRRLNRYIDPQTIVVADGGDVLAFARVALRASNYLDLGPFGCLGVGVPFANAAALVRPEARVMAVIGDGAFGFNAIEVETAVRERAAVLLVVVNNAAWNIERRDQIDHYGGRVIGTELTRSSYARLAEAFGAHGETVGRVEELDSALERALENLPAVVDVAVTRDAISPDSASGLATVPRLQATQPWDDAERRWLLAKDAKGDPMSVKPHEVEGRERPRGYSDVTSGNGVVAIAGQLPAEDVLENDAGLPEQFASAMTRFVEALGAAGAGAEDILSVRIYVTSIDAYRSHVKDLAPVFRETFDALYPAMTLLEVSGLVDDRALVEVEGMAVKA